MRRITLCLLAIVICSGQMCGNASVPGTGNGGTSGDGSSGGGTGPDPANTVLIFDNGNNYTVSSNPPNPTEFTTDRPYTVTLIRNYHWSNGNGTSAVGTISLQSSTGTTYGPWQATGLNSTTGVRNAYWACAPNVLLPAGSYTVVDSDPATWSQNTVSGAAGITHIEGIPSSVPSDDTGTGGETPVVDIMAELHKRTYVTVHFDDGAAESSSEGTKHYEEWKAQITWSGQFFTTKQRINGNEVMGTVSADGTTAVNIQATDQSAAAQGIDRWIVLANLPYAQGPEPGDQSGAVNMVYGVTGEAAKSHVTLHLTEVDGNLHWVITQNDITTWYKSHAWVGFSSTP